MTNFKRVKVHGNFWYFKLKRNRKRKKKIGITNDPDF